jgi:hypothetical protein
MKTFNKTLIAATTIATLGLAAAPTAFSLEGSASIATTYLWRGAELGGEDGAGNAAFSADVSDSMGAVTYGLWVTSGDAQTEYDLYVDYSGEVSGIGYSLGYVDYNYADGTSDFEEAYYGLSYGPASVTVYEDQDDDTDYTVFGYEAGAFSIAYGDDSADGSHTDVTYSVNDSLSLTVSDSDQADELIVVASYSMPF